MASKRNEVLPLGEIMVSLKGVSKSYDSKRNAVGDVSFAVHSGEFLVLLGPSGSGKSTILRSIAGIERIDRGSISIRSRTVAEPGLHLDPERRDVAMVFQDYALWPHMTVAANVAFALKRDNISAKARLVAANELLERVGLQGKAQRYPGDLSGGEQQRVALARALVGHRGLILFDEPLSNLDADLRERLRIEISTLVREARATAIYITHDQSEAFALADRVGVLNNGRLVQYGSPEEIFKNPADLFVARFTGLAGELPGTVVGSPTGQTVEVKVAGGTFFLVAKAHGSLRCGQAVSIAIRPAAVSLDSPGETIRCRARVLDVAYRGRGYEHAVAVGEHVLHSVFSSNRVIRGTEVALKIDPVGCMAFAQDQRGINNSSSASELSPSLQSASKFREVAI